MNKIEELKQTPEYQNATKGKKTAMVAAVKYGKDYYAKIGSKGGKSATNFSNLRKGFGSMDKAKLREVGSKGGKKSKRNRKLADFIVHYEKIEKDRY